MKRRGMYSSSSFFKLCVDPAGVHALNRFNDDRPRPYPYNKGRIEYAPFGWNSDPRISRGDMNGSQN
jgi:hypothetical protein